MTEPTNPIPPAAGAGPHVPPPPTQGPASKPPPPPDGVVASNGATPAGWAAEGAQGAAQSMDEAVYRQGQPQAIDRQLIFLGEHAEWVSRELRAQNLQLIGVTAGICLVGLMIWVLARKLDGAGLLTAAEIEGAR